VRQHKETKDTAIQKEEIKLTFFQIMFTENSKETTDKLTELYREFRKLFGTKLMSKNLLHFYISKFYSKLNLKEVSLIVVSIL
jgi:hypothetical protein